jgi:hypothetical protein
MAVKKVKVVKEKAPKPEKVPTATIIDFINWLTWDKKKWEDLSITDQKAFQPYIVNRFLSMDLTLCEAINELQQYTIGMDKDKVWRVYYELLPRQKYYLKYIKSAPIEGLEERDILILKKYFSTTEEIAIDYFKTLNKTNEGKEKLENIKRNYTYEKF